MDLSVAEHRLAETPCYAGRRGDGTIFPNDRAPALLRAKWLAEVSPPAGSVRDILH